MAAESKKVIMAALIGNLMVAVTKFIATAVTGSSAMFSEAIHSVVDTCNQALMLYGLKRAKLPADKNFPFGHGKEIYFWSFVVAIMIFGVGAGLSVYEGIHSLKNPAELQNPIVNYIVLTLAIIFEGVAWAFAWKAFSRQRGSLGCMPGAPHSQIWRAGSQSRAGAEAFAARSLACQTSAAAGLWCTGFPSHTSGAY